MNLFSEIEGLRGENLSSGLLRFVLMRSQDARVKFAEMLTALYAESFSAVHRFACMLEEWTDDDANGRGRIDLIIEMDDTLVGVENKFSAPFQEGQPQKYLQHLIKKASELANLGSIRKNRPLLVILAPSHRKSEVQKKIAELSKELRGLCKFLAWEDLLSELQAVAPTQDGKTREVITDFTAYVNVNLRQSFFHQDTRWFESLSNWVAYGSERQRKVVSDLYDFFTPVTSGRLSVSDEWVGYYFGNMPWYGFVDRERSIKEYSRDTEHARDAEFVIVVGYDLSAAPDPGVFHRVSMRSRSFCGQIEKSAWAVDIEKLDSSEKWTRAILPFTSNRNLQDIK